MNLDAHESLPAGSPSPKRPPVNADKGLQPLARITFETPEPPRYPRLVPLRRASRTALRSLLLLAAVVWVFGGMLFFFLRFSFRFYEANQRAIEHALDRLLH